MEADDPETEELASSALASEEEASSAHLSPLVLQVMLSLTLRLQELEVRCPAVLV